MNAVVAPLDKTPTRIDLLLRKALLDKLGRLDNAVLTIRDPLGEFELGSEGTDGDGSRCAAAACRIGVGAYPRGDGSARGRQHSGVGCRQAAADPGCGNALSAQTVEHDAPGVGVRRSSQGQR